MLLTQPFGLVSADPFDDIFLDQSAAWHRQQLLAREAARRRAYEASRAELLRRKQQEEQLQERLQRQRTYRRTKPDLFEFLHAWADRHDVQGPLQQNGRAPGTPPAHMLKKLRVTEEEALSDDDTVNLEDGGAVGDDVVGDSEYVEAGEHSECGEEPDHLTVEDDDDDVVMVDHMDLASELAATKLQAWFRATCFRNKVRPALKELSAAREKAVRAVAEWRGVVQQLDEEGWHEQGEKAFLVVSELLTQTLLQCDNVTGGDEVRCVRRRIVAEVLQFVDCVEADAARLRERA